MGTSIKPKTQVKLRGLGVLACFGGGAALWALVHWIPGVVLIVFGVYFFFSMIKYMAGNGQRF